MLILLGSTVLTDMGTGKSVRHSHGASQSASHRSSSTSINIEYEGMIQN